MNRRIAASAAVAILGLSSFGSAGAASVSYYLDQSNVDAYLPDGTNYLQVTISDATFGLDTGAIRFDVTLLAPLTSIAGTNFGIQSFGFNTDLGVGAVLAAIAGLPAGWAKASNTNQDGFGNFELVDSGSGSSRQSPTLTFYVTGIAGDAPSDYTFVSSGTAGQGNVMFATHVAGFLDQDPGAGTVDSGYFGGSNPGSTTVPVPAAAWLMVSGFGVLSRLRRRT